MNGASNHWATSGVTTILTPTPTGFRVQVTYLPGPITPATANQLRWQVNWRATPLRHTYTFAGQHIAQRQGKTFTYLHTDRGPSGRGSTLLATDQTGAVVGGNQPRYAAYGRERTPSVAALPTEYTFTGQKLDGTGLIYMNARYYDPQLGTFISPDSLVPDATSLADYNRYLYAQGNPMRYTDPSGHQEFEGVCTYCQDEEGSGAPDRGDGSAFHLGGVDIKALEVETVAETARQANAADGTVVYDAPAIEEIGSSQTSDTVTLENSIESEPCSFSRETIVTTQDGQKPIGVVKTGDLVLAYNETLGKTDFYTVTATMAHVDPVVVTLTLDGEQIHTTPEHPFYTISGNWVTAGNLHPGDRIRKAKGNPGFVQAIEVVQRQRMMYDLTVAQAHTFFVGEEEWLVHNCENTKRPSGWRKLVSKVMEEKSPRDADGDMICPACGQKMNKPSPDHYPTVAERRTTRTYNTRQEFLDDYYNPDELRPVCYTCNVSHQWENTPTDQLPHWPKPPDPE